MELFLFGRTLQGGGRAFAAGDDLRDIVEVTGADFALVPRRRVAVRLDRKLRFLQFGIRRHAAFSVAAGQVKHAVIERVESSQGNELKLVTHRAEFALELRDGCAIEFLLPVKRRRTVVGQQLVRKFFVNTFGETLRLFEIRFARLAPDKIGKGRVT